MFQSSSCTPRYTDAVEMLYDSVPLALSELIRAEAMAIVNRVLKREPESTCLPTWSSGRTRWVSTDGIILTFRRQRTVTTLLARRIPMSTGLILSRRLIGLHWKSNTSCFANSSWRRGGLSAPSFFQSRGDFDGRSATDSMCFPEDAGRSFSDRTQHGPAARPVV